MGDKLFGLYSLVILFWKLNYKKNYCQEQKVFQDGKGIYNYDLW